MGFSGEASFTVQVSRLLVCRYLLVDRVCEYLPTTHRTAPLFRRYALRKTVFALLALLYHFWIIAIADAAVFYRQME